MLYANLKHLGLADLFPITDDVDLAHCQLECAATFQLVR
jgi:hypothetical protein